jgi:hypothetical protein
LIENREEYSEGISPVISVEHNDSVKLNESLLVRVKHLGYNGCTKYSRYVGVNTDSSLNITFYAKYPNNAICPQSVIDITTEISLKFYKTGVNYINFLSSGKNYLLDSVFVKGL